MSNATKQPLDRRQLGNLLNVLQKRIQDLTGRKVSQLSIAEDLLSIGTVSHAYGTSKSNRSQLSDLGALYVTACQGLHKENPKLSDSTIQGSATKAVNSMIRTLSEPPKE